MFSKPFLYLFVCVALISAGTVLAQDVPVTDSLHVVAVDSPDTVAFAGDSIPVDSTVVVPKKEPPFQTRIKYKAADSVKFDLLVNRAYMYKQTQVNYEDVELKAFKTEFDMASKVVYAKGGRDSLNHYLEAPTVKQGNTEYDADSMSYNFQSKKAVIHRIKTHQGDGFMQATKAKRYPDGHIDMGGGIYTTCDADHPHFGLRLTKGKLIPGDQVVFGPAYMELLGIPLYPLMLPFGFFPQTNKEAVSGILPPTFGMEISRGLSFTNGGYYFAFNDHFDAQIMGDIFTSGTWKVNLTTRYMKRYKFSGNLDLNYGVEVLGEKGLNQTKTKAYHVTWNHKQDAKANPNHNFSASVNYGSSSYDNQFKWMDVQARTTNTKSSSINFSQKWPNSPFSFNTNLRASQTSNDGMISIDFPNFNFRMERIYPFRKKESVGKAKWYEDIALQYDATMQNSLRGHEDNLFDEKNLQKMKNGFQHKIPFSINFKALKYFNITPSLNYTGVLFTSRIKRTFDPNSNDGRGAVVTDTIRGLSYAHSVSPNMSVSMTPKFFLMNTYGPNSKVEAIRTVISPTVSVNYVPNLSRFFNYHETYVDGSGVVKDYSIYESQGAFSVPAPPPGQSGSVNIGVNGNVEMKVRSNDTTSNVQSKKVKILNNISANTSYNMFADSMNWSNIRLAANTTLFGLNLTMSGSVDPYKLTPTGTRINQFGPRLTNMSFNTGITLPLNKDDKKKENNKENTDDPYSYFDIPWNVTFNYGLTYDKPRFDGKFRHTLSFSGNVSLTAKWSLNFSSSYDFDAKKIATTTATIQRDLHCWEMSFNFSPFGVYKFYYFVIHVKSSTLKDLKYEKRKTQTDSDRMRW